MKKILILAFFSCCFSFVFAQNELVVHNSGKQLYLNHTVTPKENFYSIGRLYNVSPKDIAAFNSLDMNKGLKIEEVIKVPLSTSNFSQKTANGRPVYYVVGEQEGLYTVSNKNNGVLMANLRKWNRLQSDQLTAGKKLIVGYLVSDESNKITQANIQQPAQHPAPATVVETPAQPEKAVAKVSEPENPTTPPVAQPTQKPAVVVANANGGGYFKTYFEKQIKVQPEKNNITASAGIFKTSSGWQDAKYYALMDKVEPGTIVRITNPTNNKVIFAKVLGEMSGIRQNEGYDIRMSNAAASALDVSDAEKFVVQVNY